MSSEKCKFCNVQLRSHETTSYYSLSMICDPCRDLIKHNLPISLMEKLIERIERLEAKVDEVSEKADTTAEIVAWS